MIGGYVSDEKRLASLLVGAYQDGALHYVGEVELGFPPGTRPYGPFGFDGGAHSKAILAIGEVLTQERQREGR